MSVQDSKRSGRRALTGLLAAAALLSAGCASTVDSRFTAYHAWPAQAVERSYRFVPPPQREQSLEQAAHQALARPELERAGFSEAAGGRFGVTLLFSEERVLRRVVEPWGVSPWVGWGAWPGRWHGWGFGATIPLGWPQAYDDAFFRRTLKLEIADLAETPPRRVYEATSVSDDLGADPAKVLPVMLRQLLQDFPGPSAVQRRASTPLP